MPPVQPPKPEPPTPQTATDEPRSRARLDAPGVTASGAAPGVTAPGVTAPLIEVRWKSDATRALSGENSDKRALHRVLRRSIAGALRAATPHYPALKQQLESIAAPDWKIDATFVSDAQIQTLNAEHRGKDKPTDVLSFPVWEGDFVFPLAPGQSQILLGDLVISIETAARQARELGHELADEIAFLAVHGVLHLLGYDHGTDAQRRRMFALQDEIVARVREEKRF